MNALIIGNNCAEAYPLYEYLKYNVLPCRYNPQRLREKVREVYVDILLSLDIPESEEGTLFPMLMPTPSVEQVADDIYDNCTNTIALTLTEMGASLEMIDHIVSIFDHDAGATLEMDVSTILWEEGYPSPTFKESKSPMYRANNPIQIKVIKGWC